MKNPVFLLWLEGVHPEGLAVVPALSRLITHGVDLRLKPLPLVEAGQCYYQVLTGMGPGKFGRFDAVRVEAYKVYENTGTPEGAQGCLLQDMLRVRNCAVISLEVNASKALDALRAADQALDFALIRLLNAGSLAPEALDALVQRCIDLASPSGHVLVLTDVWSPPPTAFVNVNDFLAGRGLLEAVAGEARDQDAILWPESLAYGLGTGQIWVNLRGREPEGIVGSGREYEDVCDALVRELRSNWLDPRTNQPLVEQVFKRDELYSGDYLFRAPDLVTVYRPGYVASPKATSLQLDGESVQALANPVPTSGPYARLIAGSPVLASGFSGEATLIDIVPTVMYLLGQAIPQRVDGEVISSMFTRTFCQQTPIERVDDGDDLLSDEEEGMIVDRLRDLGYLG